MVKLAVCLASGKPRSGKHYRGLHLCASDVCRNKFESYSVRLVAALVHSSYPVPQPAKKEIFIGGEVIVESRYVRCPGNDLLQRNFLT